MEVTFWGVRGSIPAPGPGTVRYGGNTACVSVRTARGGLLVLDCGTGARNLGLALLGEGFGGAAGGAGGAGGTPASSGGRGSEAAILLSHTHWDHIQGFPFFSPLYIGANAFKIYGPAQSSELLEGILEGQMAPQYFPVQTLKNMGARIDIVAVPEEGPFDVLGCRVTAALNPHGRAGALAFRIEDAGRTLVYASDAGYRADGPPPASLSLYRDADLLIHDSTYTPEDRARYPERGLASVAEAVAAAASAGARRLALFHYDQDYTDADLDVLLARARTLAAAEAPALEIIGAAEGLTLSL
jgi:phosphoribosyl 1,2-cyclic phosphodiesterase